MVAATYSSPASLILQEALNSANSNSADLLVQCAVGTSVRIHSLLAAASSPDLLRPCLEEVHRRGVLHDAVLILPDVEDRVVRNLFGGLADVGRADREMDGDSVDLANTLRMVATAGTSSSCLRPSQREKEGVERPEKGNIGTKKDTGVKTKDTPIDNKFEDIQTLASSSADVVGASMPTGEEESPARKARHRCPTCDKQLCSSYSLRQHLATHQNSRPFKCRACSKRFTQKSHLTVHTRSHSGEKPKMCSECGKRFASLSNLRKHQQSHEREKIADAKVNINPKDAENTEPTATGLSPAVEAVISLRMRVRDPKSVPPPPPPPPPPPVVPGMGRQPDLASTSTTASLQCPQCLKDCRTRSALEKHLLVHSGARPHECPECHKRFSQRSHLNHHLRTVHATPDDAKRRKSHVCLQCGSSFASLSTLKKHFKLHTNERPFSCSLCPRRFIQKAHLEAHERSHTGERPFLCHICVKSFVTRSSLKEHTARQHPPPDSSLLSSDASKPHACPDCDARYSSRSDLVIHQRHHTGELPFTCSFCPKRFRAKRHLADHERTHTGQKPFHCHNCYRSFAAPGGLQLHFKRNDTCRLTAAPGAFSVDKAARLLEEEATTETVVVDFSFMDPALEPVLSENPPSDLVEGSSMMDADAAATILMMQQETESLAFPPPPADTTQS